MSYLEPAEEDSERKRRFFVVGQDGGFIVACMHKNVKAINWRRRNGRGRGESTHHLQTGSQTEVCYVGNVPRLVHAER